MRIETPYILEQKLDLDKILGKNCLRNELIRPTYKFARLVLKTSSKVQEPKIYDEIISNHIYDNKW